MSGMLHWQCRRGIKEVEVLLEPFYLRFFNELDEYHKSSFELVLQCQDVDLFEWFTGRSEPQDPRIKDMIEIISNKLSAVDA